MEFATDKHGEPESDEFYFESDHLALKGNKDYLALLKVLAILQAQRIKVLEVCALKLLYFKTFVGFDKRFL